MEYVCPHCDRKTTFHAKDAGKTAECAHCAGRFGIPLPTARNAAKGLSEIDRLERGLRGISLFFVVILIVGVLACALGLADRGTVKAAWMMGAGVGIVFQSLIGVTLCVLGFLLVVIARK